MIPYCREDAIARFPMKKDRMDQLVSWRKDKDNEKKQEPGLFTKLVGGDPTIVISLVLIAAMLGVGGFIAYDDIRTWVMNNTLAIVVGLIVIGLGIVGWFGGGKDLF